MGTDPAAEDYTASLVTRDRLQARGETITAATGLTVRLRGLGARQLLHVTLVEDDGTSWDGRPPADGPCGAAEALAHASGCQLTRAGR